MEKPEINPFDPNLLVELANTKMPFGKYQGWLLCRLPEAYVVWFKQKGFPPGKLGMQLATLHEIQLNGLIYLLTPLIKK
ncbi:DUF3820 family protein [Sphingobacterium oryzagri]|uniref:DUF3820 family protein n=1 Tax=Sphingobacterium oryzagri TaxID=3025669 RepID=A0ABY7WJW1_9SPHI|nr:DUF3820 family protein [Sphingobacterium sp. KACC 22765]WDF68889.1 DUF3820 family protein [Sphingobacterium sp. KACC 22765]